MIVTGATGGIRDRTRQAAALATDRWPALGGRHQSWRQIRDFARATGRLAKTDSLDAAAIDLFAERIRPEPKAVADEAARHLTELVARRQQIVEMIGAESNRAGKPATSG